MKGFLNAFANIFVLIFCVLWCPTIKLLVYNKEYFQLSILEAATATLVASLVLAIPLIVASAARFLRNSIQLFLIIILVSCLITTYFLPVNLDVIDGADRLFELRTEVWYAHVLAGLVFFLLMMLRVFCKNSTNYIFLIAKKVKNAPIIYLAIFTVYGIIGGLSIFSLTGSSPLLTNSQASKDLNIFIISFDQIQGSFLKGYFIDYPEAKDVFPGFIFYPDTASTYPNTNYSMASVLTGRLAKECSEGFSWAIRSSNSILYEAKKAGFEVFMGHYPKSRKFYTAIFEGERAEFNIIKAYELLRHGMNLNFGIDIVAKGITLPRKIAGRHDPMLLDRVDKMDLHLFEAFSKGLTLEGEGTRLFFMHFLGTHQPFMYDRKCNLMTSDSIRERQDFRGAQETLECVLFLLSGFINRLQSIDAYDRSIIFVISDHGYELDINALSQQHNAADIFHYFGPDNYSLGNPLNIKPAGSYNPLLMFKKLNSNEPFVFSDEPRSLLDIAPTICSIIKDCGLLSEGISLYERAESDRERTFWLYQGGRPTRTADGAHKYHENLKFWKLVTFDGPLYPNIAFAMGLTEPELYPIYQIGLVLQFNKKGQELLAPFLADGWSHPGKVARWTDGEIAALSFRFKDRPASDLLFRVYAFPYLANGQIEKQDVEIIANNVKISTWSISNQQWYEALIQKELIADNSLTMEIHIKNPLSPYEFGLSSDRRKLGIAVRELQIVEFSNN